MKIFENLVVAQLQADTCMHADPFNVHTGSRGGGGGDLEKSPGFTLEWFFVDFLSAFSTLQPHLMERKLLPMDVNPHLILWVMSFLTARPQ